MRCKGSKVAEWSNRQWCLTSQLEDFEVVFCQRIFCCKWGDMLTSYGQFAFLELSCPRLAMLKPWHISIGYGYGSNFGRLNVLGLVPRYDQALTGPQFHHTSYHIISFHNISYHIISYHIYSWLKWLHEIMNQRIGLRENLNRKPSIFPLRSWGFPVSIFPPKPIHVHLWFQFHLYTPW